MTWVLCLGLFKTLCLSASSVWHTSGAAASDDAAAACPLAADKGRSELPSEVEPPLPPPRSPPQDVENDEQPVRKTAAVVCMLCSQPVSWENKAPVPNLCFQCWEKQEEAEAELQKPIPPQPKCVEFSAAITADLQSCLPGFCSLSARTHTMRFHRFCFVNLVWLG